MTRVLTTALAALALMALSACGDDPAGPGPDTVGGSDTSPLPDTLDPTNRAPELERIGDRVAVVGRPLVITVNALDPDGDTLTWSLFGDLPEGARFDKASRRFEWTPSVADQTVYLTFVVSDGLEYDRETIRVAVVDELSINAPVFSPVGDRAIPVDLPFEMRLEATDPDGERVTYGHDGALPTGAALDPNSGIFTWTPTSAAVGAPTVLTFTASDGTSVTSLELKLVVDDGREGLARPPAFTMGKGPTATVGEALSLPIEANDPNGDALTFAIVGEGPSGARVEGARFAWTPGEEDAGRAVVVVLSASDGTFTALHVLTITVQRRAGGTCGADPFEANETFATAKTITPGTHEGAICDSPSASDNDHLRFSVGANLAVEVRLEFDAALGDLDLYLLDATEDILAASEGVSGLERVNFTTSSAMELTVAIVGYSDVPLAVPWKLSITSAPAAACIEDAFGGNHSKATARRYDGAVGATTLMLCAENPDYWSFTPGCGASIDVLLEVMADGADLDVYLYDSADGSGPGGTEPIAAAITENRLEELAVPAARTGGAHIIEVVSYPNNAVSAPYELIIETSGGCVDDGLANGTRAAAAPLPEGTSTAIICCSDDWYKVDIASGEVIFVEFESTGGAVRMVALAPDGATQLDADGPKSEDGLIIIEPEALGAHYLRVSGPVGASYTMLVERF